ncbi:hypothetical protein SAMN05421508_10454 [Caenispirillum bisanense]|uniref:Uncharacterized protein n=1 Tax=Caenispirillum bisanense TaxID=414052 RepID=A0A286GGI8_9PROT|nr:hypothetical protein SAMN05421508_10454 [Caenispirillum bisanense]
MTWSTVADFATALTLLATAGVLIGLVNTLRDQRRQALLYLHGYLARDELSAAREAVRCRLSTIPYAAWTDDDKLHASRVCASYDQAGFLMETKVIAPAQAELLLRSSWGESVCDQYEALEGFLDARQTPSKTGRAFFVHFGRLY